MFERENFTEEERTIIYNLINQADQSENYFHVITILWADAGLIGVMARNPNLLYALKDYPELQVEQMIQII